MIRQFFLRALLVAGIATNIAFLLINIRPERPHLSALRHFTVLVRMSAQDAKWFQENILSEFAASHDLELKVEVLPTFDAILERLQAEAKKPTSDVLLSSINDALADNAMNAGVLTSASSVASEPALAGMKADYLPEAISRARIDTKDIWVIPYRSEVDVGLFNETAVEDAFMHWQDDQAAISAALKEVNGVGLPPGYELERAPDDWDSYDIFVAAWYWAHHPAPWAGPKHQGLAPRLALRAGKGDSQLRDLLNAFYRHGATDAEIGAGKVDVPAVIDALQWQALWVRHGLAFVGKDGHGATPDEMRELLHDSALAWVPSNGEMSFRLHGGSRPDADPGVVAPGALAWSPLPQGVSVELGKGGPARRGRSYSLEAMYFWAIPKTSPDAVTALKLARFATSAGLAQREAEALGTLPIRNDIRKTYPILFRLAWMQDIFDASFNQLDRGTGQMPDAVVDDHYDAIYRELQQRVVFSSAPGPLTTEAIRQRVLESSHAHP